MRVVAVIVLVLAGSVSAAGRVDNAALLYWRAFDLMPNVPGRVHEKIMAAAGARSFTLDDAGSSALAHAQPAIDLVMRGASIEMCDWGFDFDGDDFGLAITHPQSARRLAAYTILQARLLAALDKSQRATDLIRAAAGAGMMGIYTQHQIERIATDAARNGPAHGPGPAAEAQSARSDPSAAHHPAAVVEQ